MIAPDPWIIAFALVALAMFPVAVYFLVGGEPVGEMRCPWPHGFGTSTVRVRVQRFVRKGGLIPRVQVQVGLASSFSYAPAEARALAQLLEEVAAEAEAR